MASSTVEPRRLASAKICMISCDRSGSRLPVGSSAIEDQRVVDQRARDGDALLLAAGELRRIGVQLVVEAHGAQRLVGLLLVLLRRQRSSTVRMNERFSKTVIRSMSLKSWKTMPISRRKNGSCERFIALRLRPLTTICPSVGCICRRISFSSVDLPAPLGAGEEDELALLDVERHVVQRRRVAVEPLRDVVEVDHPGR